MGRGGEEREEKREGERRGRTRGRGGEAREDEREGEEKEREASEGGGVEGRAVTIRQIGILHIACKMFAIYCCIAIHRCGYY